MTIRLADPTCEVHVTSHPWYLPHGGLPRPGPVVDRRGFPLIDEHTAVRERFELTRTAGPTNRDLADLVHWIGSHRTPAGRAPRLETLLHRLDRDAPHTRQAIDHIVDHARHHYAAVRHTPGLETAMQTLSGLTAPHRQPRPRAR